VALGPVEGDAQPAAVSLGHPRVGDVGQLRGPTLGEPASELRARLQCGVGQRLGDDRRQRRADFFVSLAAFLGVALLGVLPGILIAILNSIGDVFRRIWMPNRTTLGRTGELEGLHDVATHPDAQVLPGCPIYRFDAPLIFANAATFREDVRRLAAADPRPDWIVVAATVLAAIAGARRGFVAGVLSLIGFIGGAYAGARLAPLLLEGGSSSPWAPLFGLAGAMLADRRTIRVEEEI